MKIHFTKKEYLLLLDMLHIAEWVQTSHLENDEQKKFTEPYQQLMQKIFAYAREARCEQLLDYDKKSERYFPSRDYELNGDFRGFIEQFEEDTFWEELPMRLASRDLYIQFSEQEIMSMKPFDRATKLHELEEPYREELQENGIEFLQITKPRKVH